jgi:endoglucanase
MQRAMAPGGIVFDRSTITRMIAKPLEVSRKLNLPLYCGEWGCIDRAPMDSRVRWYQDVCAVLEDNHIGWAAWDFQGGFGLIKDGQPVTPVIRALGLRI